MMPVTICNDLNQLIRPCIFSEQSPVKTVQSLVVAKIDSPYALVFKQILPNGSTGTWAFILKPSINNSTRLIFRRRGSHPSVFDKIAMPGYYFMDMGMLTGIRERAQKH